MTWSVAREKVLSQSLHQLPPLMIYNVNDLLYVQYRVNLFKPI